MTHRIVGSRTTIIAAAGIVAGLSLATTSALVNANHDDRSRDLREAIDGGRAKNVILFLGDGMGDSEITVARNYQVGANGRLWMDTPAVDRRVHDLRAAGIQSLADRLRHRLGGLRHRMGDRIQDQQRPDFERRRHRRRGDPA